MRRMGKEIEEMLAYSSRLARYHSSPDAASLMMIMVGLPCEYGHTEMKFLPFFEYNNVRQINCPRQTNGKAKIKRIIFQILIVRKNLDSFLQDPVAETVLQIKR